MFAPASYAICEKQQAQPALIGVMIAAAVVARFRPAEELANPFADVRVQRIQYHSTRDKMMGTLTKKTLKAAALLCSLTCVGVAQAASVPGQGSWETTLKGRDLDGNAANGFEAFYDTDLNVTWLRAGSSNVMDWSGAKTWAEQERFGLTGWRLPTTHVTTADGSCSWSDTGGTSCGHNPDSSVLTGSEMAHLFYQTLGNKSYYVPGTTTVQPGWGLTNSGNFQNLQSSVYWSDTLYEPNHPWAWAFYTNNGHQGLELSWSGYGVEWYALAVRPGDVTSAVPEPQTWALVLLGLTGVLLARRGRAI